MSAKEVTITGMRIEWMDGSGNLPYIHLELSHPVDDVAHHMQTREQWTRRDTDLKHGGHLWLCRMGEWARFMVTTPHNPTGGLGGTINLDPCPNGDLYQVSGAWSSNAAYVNDRMGYIGEEQLTEVIVHDPGQLNSYGGRHGLNITVGALIEASKRFMPEVSWVLGGHLNDPTWIRLQPMDRKHSMPKNASHYSVIYKSPIQGEPICREPNCTNHLADFSHFNDHRCRACKDRIEKAKADDADLVGLL